MDRHGLTPAKPATLLRAAEAAADSDASAGLQFPHSRRLRLRGLCYADIPELSRLYAQTLADPLLVESPTRFIDVAAQVARINRCYAEHPGLGIWRAETHDGRFVGTFSLLPLAGSDDVEVGARLTPEIWGRWYAIEGGHVLCRQAFDVLGLPRLLGYCHAEHRTAHRVLDRFGFVDTGTSQDPAGLIHRYELQASAWREARRLYT